MVSAKIIERQLCLVVDGSISGITLALIDLSVKHPSAEASLWSMASETHRGAQKISEFLREGLAVLGMEIKDIHYLAVSVGPGSFTGIKVAMAWVYGLFAGQRGAAKIVGFSSMEEILPALLAEATQKDQPAKTLLFPSTRTVGFLCQQHLGEGTRSVSLVQLQSPSDQEKILALASSGDLFYVSPWPELEAFLGGKGTPLALTKAAELAMNGLVARVLAEGQAAFQDQVPEPFYLRKTTVEEKAMQMQAPINHPEIEEKGKSVP